MSRLLTVDEVAGILQVSKATVRNLTKRGKLKYIRLNNRGDRRFLREDIDSYISENRDNHNEAS